jgi:hypothetical protein
MSSSPTFTAFANMDFKHPPVRVGHSQTANTPTSGVDKSYPTFSHAGIVDSLTKALAEDQDTVRRGVAKMQTYLEKHNWKNISKLLKETLEL